MLTGRGVLVALDQLPLVLNTCSLNPLLDIQLAALHDHSLARSTLEYMHVRAHIASSWDASRLLSIQEAGMHMHAAVA